MRHRYSDRGSIDRGTKKEGDNAAYVCEHGDCRRVTWHKAQEVRKSIKISSCYECRRPTRLRLIETDIPDNTIMLDAEGEPWLKSEEEEIPIADS